VTGGSRTHECDFLYLAGSIDGQGLLAFLVGLYFCGLLCVLGFHPFWNDQKRLSGPCLDAVSVDRGGK